MTEAYISIPMSTFNTLSSDAQEIILGTSKPVTLSSHHDNDGPVELTTAQVKKLLANLSDKTTLVLKTVAKSSTPEFKLKDLIDAIPDAENNNSLRGAFSAITRRTRTVCDDADVDLFWWKEDHVHDEDGELIDITGYTSALTHASLKKVFGF